MDTQKYKKIEVFLRQQMESIGSVADRYLFDSSGEPYPKRDLFGQIQSYVDDFLSGSDAHSWCVLTGLRGAGKTTLLMQILSHVSSKQGDILFLSVDRMDKILNVSLSDVLQVYEDMTDELFETRKRPLFLFIDEAQYDKNWGVTLKDVYDRGKGSVFILVTGSAALQLTENKDVVRRSHRLNVFPMSFVEYMRLRKGVQPPDAVRKRLQDALFYSKDAKEVYDRLVSLEPSIKKYLAGVGPRQMKYYIETGSLPSVLYMQRGQVFDSCNRSLDRIIDEDITHVSNFDDVTLKKASTLLYLLASSDQVSYTKIGNTLELGRDTVKNLFDAFVKAGVLVHVPAYASHRGQVRQRSKFLFLASTFRSAIFDAGGSVLSSDAMYAKMAEDVVGFILHSFFCNKGVGTSFLTFDAQEGGADFVVSFGERKIVFEVGTGEKDFRQVKQTAKRVQPVYSVVISGEGIISLDETNSCVKVPLEYFLLA